MVLQLRFEVRDRRDLRFILERLVGINQFIIRRSRVDGKKLPDLYSSGVTYAREVGAFTPGHKEELQNIAQLYKSRAGDCEDLAAARVSQLRERGERDAQIRLTRHGRGGRVWHVTVRRADGSIEDPSRELGM